MATAPGEPRHRASRSLRPKTAGETRSCPAACRAPVTGLIFVSGAVLMALETAGSRVLGPFLGSSVFVWGSLIGIFLGAMSGGYWLGGWLSERWPRQVLLNALPASAGAFTLLLPLWAAPLCQALAGGPEGLIDVGPRLGPLTAALILFALPSLLMGVASPFAVRLLAADLARVGALDRSPNTRVNAELFHLAFHAGNLLDPGTLGGLMDLAKVRLLTDDYAPVDTLVFEAATVAEGKH